MLEVLFIVENGTTSQLTSYWSTFMHSTSSYDAQSKWYVICKMPTQCRVCEKQRKRGTKFWQVLDVVCVDENWDPHVNRGRGKKNGDIFPALGGIESGRNSCRVVSLGHWASSLLLLQIRHFLRWSDPLLRLCVLAVTPMSTVVNMLNKREDIWRGLYVERRTVGTHQVYGHTQASAWSKKYFLLML